ncbi:hypothetical protein B5X24_HaOG216741 [Helicoverpa armigera]|nr:hypothetical protein B5X24_HaOG216741 [Helicoverpa armigera]
MKSIYIVGIIILMGQTECFVEDTTSIKILKEQRTLLRKLQNFQEPKDVKPLTWNEMLADVLVNRIKIFSFHKVNENEIVKDDKPAKTNIVTTAVSQVMLFYKNCIYDKWRVKYEEPSHTVESTTEDGVVSVTTTADIDDPKGDVEIIEPKYHGKQIDGDPDDDEAVVNCPEDFIKDEQGNCVNIHSRLIISVPNQCPYGYRRDRLGNCRAVLFF